MNYYGLIIGAVTFLTIGLFHPIVIKCEYYFSCKVWPIFLMVGIGACVLSIFLSNEIASSCSAVFGFSSFWSIGELFQQKKRVEKGWFPKNPKRK